MIKRYLQDLSLAKRLGLLSTLLCLGICLTLVVVGQLSSRYTLEQQQQLYGQALATQLATQAMDTLINNDRISLQAILSQYVKNTPVAAATIYNVANQPVAKAGQTSPDTVSYSSPISFEDSIAGYAVINQDTSVLDSSRQEILISLLILSGLAALFNFAVIVRTGQALVSRLNAITVALNTKRNLPMQEAFPWHDEIESLRQEVQKLPMDQLSLNQDSNNESSHTHEGSLLYIHFTNLKTYRSQLGATSLEDYTALLQQALVHIAKLYDASINSCRECSAIMTFEGENACFRSASTAWLLRSALAELEDKYHLKLGTEMAATEIASLVTNSFDLYTSLEQEDLIDILSEYCQRQPNTILLTELCATEGGDSLRTKDINNLSVCELTGFSPFENKILSAQQLILVKKISSSLPAKI